MLAVILRREDESAFDSEWFPRNGYGVFIVFLYAVMLPSPTIYYLFKKADPELATAIEAEGENAAEESLETSGAEVFNNPMGPEEDDETVDALPEQSKIGQLLSGSRGPA
eukprot:SAG31_NODE_18050_length_648_cov_1.295082_2_plen_109_part_01